MLDFKGPSRLGDFVNLYGWAEFSLVRTRHFRAGPMLELGLAFTGKTYDYYQNPKNKYIGSNVLFVLGLGLQAEWLFAPQWSLQFGAYLTHHSKRDDTLAEPRHKRVLRGRRPAALPFAGIIQRQTLDGPRQACLPQGAALERLCCRRCTQLSRRVGCHSRFRPPGALGPCTLPGHGRGRVRMALFPHLCNRYWAGGQLCLQQLPPD